MKPASRQIFQFGFVLVSVALVVLLISNFKNKHEIERLEVNNKELVEKLEQANKESTERKTELKDTANLGENKPANLVELHSWDIEQMKRKGLKDPVKDIISDLRQHRELIPYKGSVGGTMNFYSESRIWILTKKWVLAYFEDGHNGGYLLLEYEVTKDGKIKWKTVASYIA
ncbi:MAG TPA: hypothetical protein VMW72_10155 [Sedimentisphaerales bacterium]|nr:hypothetical protein [Sedimentisphaerales bacterium]